MPRLFTRARPAIPARTQRLDAAHMARAEAAAFLRRRPELVRETYAHCDRAPLGWEKAER